MFRTRTPLASPTAVLALATLLTIALAPAKAHASDCMAASHPADVADRLKAAESALESADPDAFQGALEEVSLLVPCLAETLPSATAAQLHRLTGVQEYNAGNTAKASPAFLAARVLDPSYHFPASEFSAEHPIRTTYEAANAGQFKDKKAPEPKTGSITFDGAATRNRPADRNTVVQLLNPSSQVTQTTYLLPDQPLPTYAAVPHLRNSLLIGTVVALAGSAACYGGAWAAHGQFVADDPTYTLDQLEGYQGATNALFAASISLGVVAIGGGTGALLVGAR